MVLESRPQRSTSILSQEVSGVAVLLNPDTGHYYSLEEVGLSAWELADGAHTVRAIAASIQAEYDVPLPEIEADLLQLFDELADEQLVSESC